MDRIDIINKNIIDLNRVQAGLQECRLAHIRDKAVYLYENCSTEDDFTTDTFRQLYKEITTDDELRQMFLNEAIQENQKILADMYSEITNDERIYLCRVITEIYAGKGGRTLESYLMPNGIRSRNTNVTRNERNHIACMRNSYTDTAYDIFGRELKDPTVTYSGDFTNVCEDVYYGRANLCILPIQNSTDGNLVSFRNLINKYELKTVMTCSVDTSYNNYTKFALLKKNIENIRIKSHNVKYQNFLEFNITLSDTSKLASLLKAAESYNLHLNKIDSVPVTYSESEYSYDIVITINDSEFDLMCFLCYLYLEMPQFTPAGLYKHIYG